MPLILEALKEKDYLSHLKINKAGLRESFIALFLKLPDVENSVNKFYPHETYFIPWNYFHLSLHLNYATSTYLMRMKLSLRPALL